MLSLMDLQPGEKIVEMGCGTGMVTIKAALAVGPEGQVLATDISRRMVNHTVGRISSWNLPQISLYQALATEFYLPSNGFDAGFSALRLNHYKDPAAAMSAVYQSLRQGGRAAALVWGAADNCGWSTVFPILESKEKSKVSTSFFDIGAGDHLSNIFRKAGFADIETKRIKTTLHYASAAEALHAVFADGPATKAYSRLEEKDRREVHHQYLDSIELFRDGTAYAIPNEFVVATGKKNLQS